MAIILVNKDGTSNAKPGDIVVTGGGLYRKNEDGSSTKIGGLDTKTGTSKSYDDVIRTFSNLVSGSGSSTQKTEPQIEYVYKEPEAKVTKVDENGIVDVEIEGYNPKDYQVTYKTVEGGGGGTGSKILGYVILGLVGVALLDRFMNGKKG